MLPTKTTPPAEASFLLAGNKPASPSVVSAKQAPAGAARGVVLAVDGKRSIAALAGRGAFSDFDDLGPKEFPADLIKKVAEETSSLLRILVAPKDADQAAFSKEVDALQKMCDSMVEGSGLDVDGAATVLMGIQARMKLLLNGHNKESPNDLLISTVGQIKSSVEEYMAGEFTNRRAVSIYDFRRKSFYELIMERWSLVYTEEEVKTALENTLALLETEPVNSTRPMAGLFSKVRSDCRALLEDIEKNGINDKTGVTVLMIHLSAVSVLGQRKTFFNCASDDSLMSWSQRLEVALRDYKLGVPAGEDTDRD